MLGRWPGNCPTRGWRHWSRIAFWLNSPRLAAAPTQDLMVLDAGQRQLNILDTSGAAGKSKRSRLILQYPRGRAGVAAELNAGRDIVVLTLGVTAPTIIAAQPDSPFMVTTVNDEDDAGACPSGSSITTGAGADGVLSLREAVCEANNSGAVTSVINVPAGNYPLSISTYGGGGSISESGENPSGQHRRRQHLDCRDGASSNTIINQTNGVDRVFEQDQPLAGNVAISLANATLTGGTPTTGLDAGLGGGAILGGGANGDDLAITNVVMSNNTTASAGGAVSFSMANFVAANATFSNNTASQSVGGACACGSDNGQGNLVFTNSVFTNNLATDASMLSPPAYDMGGALDSRPGLAALRRYRAQPLPETRPRARVEPGAPLLAAVLLPFLSRASSATVQSADPDSRWEAVGKRLHGHR